MHNHDCTASKAQHDYTPAPLFQSSVEREPAHIVKECISLHPELHRDILLYKVNNDQFPVLFTVNMV